jgi:undecaprenyl-diphosphatase
MPEWIQQIDEVVLQWVREHQDPNLRRSLADLTALGSATVLALVALFAAGALLRNRLYGRALLVVLVAVGSYFASEGLKSVVDRPRPPAVGPGGPAVPASASFPSSHALRSAAVLLVAALALRRGMEWATGRGAGLYLLGWAVVLVLLIGASRLYLEAHYLSDVVGGWLVGLGFVVVYAVLGRCLPEGESV